jgi:uncharacterized DUF497 family protein
MNGVVFEWDAAKAEANYLKHGVDFPTASELFGDPFGIESVDPRVAEYREDRFLLTGMGGGSLLTVVYTQRGEGLRIISARRATKREHDNYYLQNSQA